MPLAPADDMNPYAAPAEDDGLLFDPETAEEVPDPNYCDPAEEEAIARMEASMSRPSALKDVLQGMDANRKYIHTTAQMPEVPGGVSSNYLLRYQSIHMAQLFARDPEVRARVRKKMGLMSEQTKKMLVDFGKTTELLVEAFTNDAGLRSIVSGAIQEADTTAAIIIKRRWCEDMTRDPVGTTRLTDMQVMIAETRRLLEKRENLGPAVFDEGPDGLKLRQLSADIQSTLEAEAWRAAAYPDETMEAVADPATGEMTLQVKPINYPVDNDPRKFKWTADLPTIEELEAIPQLRRFEFDLIFMEDFGIDPAIVQPEKFYNAGFMWHVSWMTDAEIRRTFSLSPETDLVGGMASDPESASSWLNGNFFETDASDMGAREGLDDVMKGDRYAVVEYHDALTRRVYHWIRGSRRLLRNELATATSKRFFPFYMLQFNRVSGRLIGVSNVDLGRSLQDEINLARTWKRQAKRGAYNRYIAENGLFDAQEMQKLEECPPEGVVTTQKSVKDIREKIHTISGNYNAEVHDVTEEKTELGTMMGAANTSVGITTDGADSATEAALANQGQDVLTAYHRWILETQILTPIFQDCAEVLVQALPEENAKAIAGPGAVWPALSREELWQNLTLEVEGGSTAMPNVAQEKANLEWMAGIIASTGGAPNPVVFAQKAAQIIGWKEEVEQYMLPAAPLVSVGEQPVQGAPKNPTGATVAKATAGAQQRAEPQAKPQTQTMVAAERPAASAAPVAA